MKKLTLAAALVATLFIFDSCKKEETHENPANGNVQDVTVRDGRISFSSSNALIATVGELTNKSTDYLNSWEDSKHFSSLRRDPSSKMDLDAFNFPQFYSTFINANGEYIVGDTIVWYHDGFKHMVPKMDEELLAKIKADPSISKNKYMAGSTPVSQETFNPEGPVQSFSRGKVQVVLGRDVVDARYQKEFNTDDGSLRKIVFEILNYVEQYPTGYNSYLITRIKQYWKGSSSWKPAGETMEKYIKNLYFTKGYNNVFNGAYVEISGTVASIPASGAQTDSNDLEYLIATTISSNPATAVRVSGNYHAKVLAPGNSQGVWDVATNWY